MIIEVPSNTREVLDALLDRDLTDEEHECISAILDAIDFALFDSRE